MGTIRVRIIDKNDSAVAKKEMEKIGVHKTGIKLMERKAVFYSVELENVPARAASIIKQEMLSLGGDAAVSWQVINFCPGSTTVLLLGTKKHFLLLFRKLKQQPFGLAQIGEEIKRTMEDYDREEFKLDFGREVLRVGKRKLIMGVLNVTPDSFYDGGRYSSLTRAVERGVEMVREGADIIDIGGESTRPGALPVDVKQELERVIPVIKELASRVKVPISIDTYKAEVAKRAIDAGASMVNDISALRMDKKMADVVRKARVPVCLMHMQGTPRNMQENPKYRDVVGEIFAFLKERIDFCQKAGIEREKIIIDPGIGFGKTVQHNLEILKGLNQFRSLGRPIMIGVSRKSLIGKILHLEPEERLEGSLASAIWCVVKGAGILRVHDVKETKRAIRMIEAIRN